MSPQSRRVWFEGETERHLQRLYRVARRMVREPADAEDLVHDAYVKAFKAISATDIDDEDACRIWLYRILINTFRDRYRRGQRSPENASVVGIDGEAMDPAGAAVSADPDPETSAADGEFAADAERAIHALPADLRLVVVLFFIDGLSHREIAEIASIPVGTAMSRLSRGRKLLQNGLANHLRPEPTRRAGHSGD